MVYVLPEAAQLIARHAEQSYPDGCVGLLLGRLVAGICEVLVPVPIEQSWGGFGASGGDYQPRSQHDRFFIDPRDYLRAEHEARIRDLEVVGCYHSHCDKAPIPSERDLVSAQGLGGSAFVFLVQRVDHAKASQSRAWLLTEQGARFVEENIQPLTTLTEGAEAAVAVLICEFHGALRLALGRAPEFGRNIWVLPKGSIEPGETAAAAALRRMRDETGLQQIHMITLLGRLRRAAIMQNRTQMIRNHRFFLAVVQAESQPGAVTDPFISETGWFSLNEAIERIPFAEERLFLREKLQPWLWQLKR